MLTFIKKLKATCALGFVVLCAGITSQAEEITELPDISLLTPYAFFGANFNMHNVQVYGDVALYDGISGAETNISSASEIYGDLYLGTGATFTDQTGYTSSGYTITNNMDFTAALNQLTTASNTLATLTPNNEYNVIDQATVLGTTNGIADIQVFNISSINLGSGDHITFNGDVGDYYVINVMDGVAGGGDAKFSMSGDAKIGDASTAPYLILNLFDNDNWGTIAAINNFIYGTMLVPDGDATSHGVFGAVYATDNMIKIQSDANLVNQDESELFNTGFTSYAFSSPTVLPPPTDPISAPPVTLLFCLGLMLLTYRRVKWPRLSAAKTSAFDSRTQMVAT